MEENSLVSELFTKISEVHISVGEMKSQFSGMKSDLDHVAKDMERRESESMKIREKKDKDCEEHRAKLHELEMFKVKIESENNLSATTQKIIDLEKKQGEKESEKKGEGKAYLTVKEAVVFAIVIAAFILSLIPFVSHSETKSEKPPANATAK